MGARAPAHLVVTDELLAVALEAAHSAGALLLERFHAPREALRAKSSPTDLVTESDLAAERTIRELLARERPGDAVLGEEGGEDSGSSEGRVRWIVDPLDGTINYLFGIPQWSVSVACEDGEGTLAGVVFDAVRDETFSAVRGGPATVNGEPVTGSEQDELAQALVATGFGYSAEQRAAQAEVLTRVLSRVRDIRRAGSAALDLAWTACARHDAFFERGVKPWDVAAGALLCRSAGLETRTLDAHGVLPSGMVAGPAPLVSALLALDV